MESLWNLISLGEIKCDVVNEFVGHEVAGLDVSHQLVGINN